MGAHRSARYECVEDVRRLKQATRTTRPSYLHGSAQFGCHLCGVRIRRVFRARPEKAAQPVAFAARDDVHVSVGNALTHAVVHRDESSFGAERAFDGPAEPLRVAEHRGELFGGEIANRLAMDAWNDEDVPWKERTSIEESDAHLVLDHTVGGSIAAHDRAELTVQRESSRRDDVKGKRHDIARARVRGSVYRRPVRQGAAIASILALSAWGGVTRAADPFEIQVYDGTANEVGAPGLELHLNDWVSGHRDASGPEAPLHGQFHATLEPSMGVMPFWELGAYFQMAVRTDDGVVDWAGIKLRSKFVTPAQWGAHWRFGINIELAYLPEVYDRDRWGSEVRPIVAWHDDDWLFALNPILGQSLAGSGAAGGPSFEPAAKAARILGPIAIGLEYYASLGLLQSPLPLPQEQHYVYEALDVLGAGRFELNLGVGEGLTPASAGIVVKAIVGYRLDPLTASPACSASNGARHMR